MLDGFGYVFGQVVVLLLLALATGTLIGRFGHHLLGRRFRIPVTEPATAPGVSQPVPTGAPLAPPAQQGQAAGPDVPATLTDARARVAYAEIRQAQSETRRAELEARLAEAQSQLAQVTTDEAGLLSQVTRSQAELTRSRAELTRSQADLAQSRADLAQSRADLARSNAALEQSQARLSEAHGALAKTHRKLSEANAEVLRLRVETRALSDQKETEMGRLESGAIAALDSTIATHQERVARLEEQLRAAEAATQHQEQELAMERRRSEQLQAALAERDQHLATLASGREVRAAEPGRGEPIRPGPAPTVTLSSGAAPSATAQPVPTVPAGTVNSRTKAVSGKPSPTVPTPADTPPDETHTPQDETLPDETGPAGTRQGSEPGSR